MPVPDPATAPAPCRLAPKQTTRPAGAVPAVVWALLMGSSLAYAAPPAPALTPSAPIVAAPLVHLDWHGELRGRAETLGGVRGNGDNAQLPTHLDLRHGSSEPSSLSDSMYGADLRLRLEPVLHVGDWSSVHTQLDAWGLAGGNSLLASFVDRHGSGDWSSGDLSASLALRRVWLHSRIFGLLDVDIGRMPDQFGMGLVRNSGDGLLGDAQSNVDRVRLQVELFGLRGAIGRSNLFSWPSSQADNGATLYNSYAGGGGPLWRSSGTQAGLSLQDSSDVIRWDFEVAGGRLHGDSGLLWALALLWQSQDTAFRFENLQNPGSIAPAPAEQLAAADCGADCILLSLRTFRSYTFQGSADWRGSWRGAPVHAEAEGDFVYGTIARTDITTDPDAKTIVAGGGAGRVTWQPGNLDLRLDLGAASGESDGGFGYNDTNNFKVGGVPDGADRPTLHGFRFHRGFRIDGLLLRDLVGGVTNTGYLRPSVHWHPLGRGGTDLRLELGVLGAMAMSPDATPGKGSLLGLEPEITAHLRLDSGLDLLARGTLVLPGDAFSNSAGVAADPAWRADAVLRWQF